MTLATIGWWVVHALWIGTALGGATALVLGLIGDNRAQLRYRVAYIGLMLMVIAPFAMVAGTVDLFTPATRLQATQVVENTVGLQALVDWRRRVVPSAAVLWLVGIVYCVAGVTREGRQLRRLKSLDLADVDLSVRDLAARLAAELRVQTAVTILRSSRVGVPMVFGWSRPQLLLPSNATARLGWAQLRAVLAHELAHVRRHDFAANLVQVAAESLLWFHPAARWVSARIRTEREYCCDDAALSVGVGAVEYAHALAALDDARRDSRLAVAAGSGTLLDRIQRIVGQPRPVLTPARGAVALIAAVAVASAIATLTMVVPPEMPLDARLRSKTRAPGPGPGPLGPSLPRVLQR